MFGDARLEFALRVIERVDASGRQSDFRARSLSRLSLSAMTPAGEPAAAIHRRQATEVLSL
jgi:hypothetical protein